MSFIPKDVELLKECISSKNITNYIKENKINAVIHFAAKISVPESIANPMKYYIENTSNTNSLISSCLNANISNFIFSSTAADMEIKPYKIKLMKTQSLNQKILMDIQNC